MKSKPKLHLLILMSFLLVILSACGARQVSSAVPTSGDAPELSDFADRRIAVMEGTVQEDMVRARFPEAKVSVYSAVPDMPLALESGAVDGFVGDADIVGEIVRNKDTLTVLDEPIGQVSAALAFPKTDEGEKLRDEMNDFIDRCRADGTLAQMEETWFSDKASVSRVDRSGLPQQGPVLNFATTGIAIPFSFFENGEVQGFDIDLAVRFCKAYGYRLNIETMSFPAIIPGLVSGRYDLAGNGIFVTEERKESVYFSDTYRTLDIVFVTEKAGAAAPSRGFFKTAADSFEKTFIREQRWRMILRGIETTVWISAAAAVLGTLLGFGLCFLRRSKNKALHAATSVYIRILQGTPQLVLLMIMFYLVLADTGIPGEWAAVITFALNFAAYACEIFRSGIDAVDVGQTEAALATGYTRHQAFFKIVMPQALAKILPVYQGEVISLIKMTSIVGYIAVQDLTKMSDIIRSRTYQAFFPLIATAVLYFIITWVLTAVLRLVRLRVEPDRGKRRIRGVKLNENAE